MPPSATLPLALAGASSATIALCLTYPLDKLRVILQAGKASSRGMSTAELLASQRMSELYVGLGTSCQTIAVSQLIFFYVFEYLKDSAKARRKHLSNLQLLAVSSAAGIVNMCFSEPLFRCTTIVQCGDYPDPKSGRPPAHLLEAAQAVRRAEGSYRALWRGLPVSIYLVSNPIINYFVLERVKAMLIGQRKIKTLTALEAFVTGAIAKTVATILTYPLQVCQSVLRAQARAKVAQTPVKQRPAASESFGSEQGKLDAGAPKQLSIPQVLRQVYGKEGTYGLFRGLTPKLMQTVLTAAITQVLQERMVYTMSKWLLVAREARQG